MGECYQLAVIDRIDEYVSTDDAGGKVHGGSNKRNNQLAKRQVGENKIERIVGLCVSDVCMINV